MIRTLHRWPGLLALALVTILSLSGAALSVFPAAEAVTSPQGNPAASVAEVAARIQSAIPGVEQIKRAPSGRITAYWFDKGTPGSAVVDPSTGQAVGSADPDQVERWLTNLHRSLFLDDTGRLVSAVGAAAMIVLSVSGILLVARRAGTNACPNQKIKIFLQREEEISYERFYCSEYPFTYRPARQHPVSSVSNQLSAVRRLWPARPGADAYVRSLGAFIARLRMAYVVGIFNWIS